MNYSANGNYVKIAAATLEEREDQSGIELNFHRHVSPLISGNHSFPCSLESFIILGHQAITLIYSVYLGLWDYWITGTISLLVRWASETLNYWDGGLIDQRTGKLMDWCIRN